MFCLTLTTCQVAPKTHPTAPNLTYDNDLDTTVAPPAGWTPDPLKHSPNHTHRAWISPSGNTAYGVISFNLPLPVGTDLALLGFLSQMKKSEGEAHLLTKTYDENLHALRFTAEGGLYKIRTTLFTQGFHAWAVYAGTLRAHPENLPELHQAELARERTRPGHPQ